MVQSEGGVSLLSVVCCDFSSQRRSSTGNAPCRRGATTRASQNLEKTPKLVNCGSRIRHGIREFRYLPSES